MAPRSRCFTALLPSLNLPVHPGRNGVGPAPMSPSEMEPVLRLGSESPGGLSLPDASASPATLYGPRGIYLDDDYLVVADSGNHRVLLWRQPISGDGAAADVVLGQPDPETEGPQAAGRGPESGLFLPTAVAIFQGCLFVADAWNHRILIWREIPTVHDAPPDRALGQRDLSSVEANRGGERSLETLYWPYGFAFIGGRFYVADTGNRRVLWWEGLPLRDRPADGLLGQPSPVDGAENRGGAAAADSFRWPHALAGTEEDLWVADAGNHRLLGWAPPPLGDRPADRVLGQPDFTSNAELPHVAQSALKLRFPYGISQSAGRLAVADTANNRVLLWNRLPTRSGVAADRVIGQDDFAGSGENRWLAVTADSLCWPYGLWFHRDRIGIADSGNNRIVVWRVPRLELCGQDAPELAAVGGIR